MNIQSISELSPFNITTCLSADDITTEDFSDNILTAFNWDDITELDEKLDFDTLSCPSMLVEVSYKGTSQTASYRSYKFDLGDALTKIAKTLVFMAQKQLNALTEASADKKYVPYTGNTGPNDPIITGLVVGKPTAGAADALQVLGPVAIGINKNDTNNSFVRIAPNDNLAQSTFDINVGTFSSKSQAICKIERLSATTISASNLSAIALSANSLSAGKYSTNQWNAKVLSSTGNTPEIASFARVDAVSSNITLLCADTLYAGKNAPNWNLLANSTNATATTFEATNITANNGDIANLTADLSSTNAKIKNLSAGLTSFNRNSGANLKVEGTDTIEVANLDATNLTGGTLYAGVRSGSTNLYVPPTGAIEITRLLASNLTAGNNLLIIKSDDEKITVSKLDVTGHDGLSAGSGTAQLTAKAACWS